MHVRLDGVNAFQIRERPGLAPGEIIERLRFCRLLSGREGGGKGLLGTFTPF